MSCCAPQGAISPARRRQTNMDVPIPIGVSLTFGMSLYQTVHQGPHGP